MTRRPHLSGFFPEEEYRRFKSDLTDAALVAAMQASPHHDIDIEPLRSRMPVRDVTLSAA